MARSSHLDSISRLICAWTGRILNSRKSLRNAWWTLPLLGLVSLIWFMVRVIPKPSRAGYPCMRVAAPVASSFVLWLLGLGGSAMVLSKARRRVGQRRWLLAAACVGLAVAIAWIGTSGTVVTTGGAALPTDPANDPIGVASGFNPGRVSWVHDPNATDWDLDSTDFWWEGSHTDQAVVDQMVSNAVRWLAGKPSESEAWEALFRHFNRERGKGDVGYQRSEKFYIKMNLTNCNSSGQTSVTSRDLRPGREHRADTSPHVIKALLKQLVNVVGVAQSDIYIGDTVSFFPNQYYEILVGEFPNVNYIDHFGGPGRYRVSHSEVPFYWSTAGAEGKMQDYLPVCVAQAAYVINVPVLKGHGWSGITICAKNHYGSMIRSPVGQEWGGTYNYYDMHGNLPYSLPARGYYRPNVDQMGHAELGGKTVLYLVDALYCGYYWEGNPRKWNMSPFNGDWPSSVFASQDGVAIDSVGYDFLNQEWPDVVSGGSIYPGAFEGVAQDYLHEAALADSPPSGTFYDPESDGVRMKSLGTHEHWNNATDKQYTRNLGMGDGIELITSEPPITQFLTVSSSPVSNVPISGTISGVTQCGRPIQNGSDVTLTAPPMHTSNGIDYVFERWLLDGVDQGADTELSFTITADVIATAVYASGSQNTNTPDISVSPSTHDFGEKNIGTTNYVFCEVTISNKGTFPLVVFDITLSETTNFHFDVNGGQKPCGDTTVNLTPSDNCSLHIVFTPLATGAFNTTLSIDSDDPDSPIVEVSIEGTGVSGNNQTTGGSGGCSLIGGKMGVSDIMGSFGLILIIAFCLGITRMLGRNK